MEVRKVQETGNGTLFTTLPKEWCKKHAINKGSMLSIELKEDGLLLIYPFTKEDTRSEITFSYEHNELYKIIDNIIGSYLLGYTIIEVISKNALNIEERDKIRDIISKLVGLEIVEETFNRIRIKFILDPNELSPDTIFSRMSFISESMMTDIIKAIEHNFDSKILESVVKRENELDRQYFLLIRLLRTILMRPKLSVQYNISPIEVMDRRMAAYFLELVGDLTASFSEELKEKAPIFLKEINIAHFKELMLNVIEIYHKSITAVLKKNRHYAEGVNDEYEKISEILSQTPKENIHLINLLDYLLKVSKATVDITDLAAALY
ncbi:MAG: phosphate uptake regulator PhoU [Nitrososphaeria archaeon]